MAVELTMPQLGLTMTEGTVSKWLKKAGDKLKQGDEVGEVETDKINRSPYKNHCGRRRYTSRKGYFGIYR